MKAFGKKRKRGPAIIAGILVISLILSLVIVAIQVLFVKPDMMTPDGYIGDPIVVETPYAEQPLADMKAGDILMNGFLALVAGHELPSFSTADEIPNQYLISLGIWLVLMDENYSQNFTLNEQGALEIPAETVHTLVSQRFFLAKNIVDESVAVFGDFTYDAEKSLYLVPVSGVNAMFAPRIKEITKDQESEIYRITAEYLEISNEFMTADDLKDAKVVKTVLITASAAVPYKLISITTIA